MTPTPSDRQPCTQPQQAILGIALMAALADPLHAQTEGHFIGALAGRPSTPEHGLALAALYAQIMHQQVSLKELCTPLIEAGASRLQAYEGALGVCHCDGPASTSEQAFLLELQQHLALPGAPFVPNAHASEPASEVAQLVQALAALPLPPAHPPENPLNHPVLHAGPHTSHAAPPTLPQSGVLLVAQVQLEQRILQASILAGGLELLPQSWACTATIALQTRMLHRVSQAYGHELDLDHLQAFMHATGLGLKAQYLELFARKLLAGHMEPTVARPGAAAGPVASGLDVSFASTYALGQLAEQVHAEGRQPDPTVLSPQFEALRSLARPLHARYAPQILQQSQQLEPARVLHLIQAL